MKFDKIDVSKLETAEQDFAKRMEEISAQTREARRHAIPRDKAVAILKMQNDLTDKRAAGTLSADEYRKLLGATERALEKCTVDFKSLPEFKEALELMGKKGDSLEDLLSHENAHANKAESSGADEVRYRMVYCWREINGQKRIGGIPMARYYLLNSLSPAEQRHIHKEVTGAPERLSELDKDDLKKF